MDKYKVRISPYAYRNLDGIYDYIKSSLFAPLSAQRLIDELENAILSLETLPRRGAERKYGRYANKGYRQLFVKNFTVVYRIDEKRRQVIIITVHYSQMDI